MGQKRRKKHIGTGEYSFTNEEHGYTMCPLHEHWKAKEVCDKCTNKDECVKIMKSKIRGG